MMNNQILDQLNSLLKIEKADFSIITHEVAFKSAAEGAEHCGISLDETTPTLILKANDQYHAAIICGSTRISFKKLKQLLDIKNITMADPETVLHITGAKVGEVCLINNKMTTLVDANVLKNKNCYGGCGTPQATLRIDTQDLIRITKASILDFTDPRS